MRKFKGIYMIMLVTATALSTTGCGSNIEAANINQMAGASSEKSQELQQGEVMTNLSQIDMSKWQYNAEDKVYYQLGISYCEKPADLTYETLAIFVPADYMTAKDNGNGTFTCALNTEAKVAGFTAETAPIVIPVETPGYSACAALTEYQDFSQYTNEGFIYVFAGCRGRDQGAPAGVTDLKAAIRYIRYNDGVMAGDMDRIFSFGMSGGGAQSALLGATGDSKMYDAYLQAIGAVQGVSDAVTGSMCWCPITSLESADAAYEWNMGASREGLSDEEKQISTQLTAAFATYINELGIKDEEGNVLTLEQSADGNYQAGTYYEYIKKVIEDSMNDFLQNTTFPYDASAANAGGMMGGHGMIMRGDKQKTAGMMQPQDGNLQQDMKDGKTTEKEGMPLNGNVPIEDLDNIARQEASSGVSLTGVYETAKDYVDALNADGKWVSYDAATNTATITSIADFSKAVKTASKGLAAFDQLDARQGENTLFGYGDGSGAHFDAMLADILKGTSYEQAYSEDLAKEDSAGNTAAQRLDMYSPLYFLMEGNEGYKTSTVAQYWRIRTGAWQQDTALTTEVNLALALEKDEDVKAVDFATVWGQKHVKAESTGDSDSNFISWVKECLGE